ncbi:hypothetical protein D3C87_81100 [compost metagenome]
MTLIEYLNKYKTSEEYKTKIEAIDATLPILNWRTENASEFMYFFNDENHKFTIYKQKSSDKLIFFNPRENQPVERIENLTIEQIVDMIMEII